MIGNIWDGSGNVLSYSEIGGKKRVNITNANGLVSEFRLNDETALELATFLTPAKNEETKNQNSEGSKAETVPKSP